MRCFSAVAELLVTIVSVCDYTLQRWRVSQDECAAICTWSTGTAAAQT